MMILKEGEVCPHSANCPYNQNSYGPCYGTLASRPNVFECEYVINGQIVVTDGVRLPGDKTGKMKVIMD